MHRFLIPVGLALLVASCGNPRVYQYDSEPSPLYGGGPCPGSATNSAGGQATPLDCVPGGRESSGNRPR